MTPRGRRVVRSSGPQGRPRWAVTVAGDRTAVLLVRVWLDNGAGSFRARLTSMDTTPGQPADGETTVAVGSTRRDVVDAVRAWLDVFVRDPSSSIDSDE